MTTSRARQLRNNPIDAERVLWKHLRHRQLDGYKFRRQQPLGSYIADFVCLEARLIVEVDGGQHVSQMVYDSERTAWLESQNFRVLRFWNDEVLQQIESVVAVILKALNEPEAAQHPHPNLLPSRGKG